MRRDDTASVFVAKVIWIQFKGKTQKNPSSSTTLTETFNAASNKEIFNLNKVCQQWQKINGI